MNKIHVVDHVVKLIENMFEELKDCVVDFNELEKIFRESGNEKTANHLLRRKEEIEFLLELISTKDTE
jgi:phosphopantothenate synthetase